MASVLACPAWLPAVGWVTVVLSVEPSTNAGRTDSCTYLGISMPSASGPPFVDLVANLSSNQGIILSQDTHVVDWGFWPCEISPDMNDARINVEASSLVQQFRHMSSGIDKQAGTPYPEHLVADICDEDFHATPSSDSMSLTSFSGFSLSSDALYTPPQSTLGELEGFVPGPTPIILSKDSREVLLAAVAVTRNWDKERMSTDIPLDPESQYNHSGATSSDSTLLVIPGVPADVQYEDQRASLDTPQQFQQTEKGSVGASSQSSPRAASVNGSAKPQYACNICWKTYSQSQGVRRHQREVHKATLCTYCLSFEWGRPYRLREHLKKQHPEVDVDVALKEATRKRPKTRRNSRSFPQQVSLPNPPHNRQSHTKSQTDYPLAPSLPLPAVVELPPTAPTHGVREDAEYAYSDAKAESQRPRQKKMGVAPGCGIRYRHHSRGFGVNKDTPFLVSEATN